MACCGRRDTAGEESNPILLGEPNDQSGHYTVRITTAGVGWGDSAWFTGTDVPDHVAAGFLEVIE